jgi:phage shock protein PspC (stress-responsive transcriptional regulator)
MGLGKLGINPIFQFATEERKILENKRKLILIGLVGFLIYKNNEQLGPFEEQDIVVFVNEGKLSYQDLGWKEGMTEWKSLKEILLTPKSKPRGTKNSLSVEKANETVRLSDYQGFYRSSDEKTYGGVCGGLAHKWGMSHSALQMIFIISGLFFVLPIVIYICCWIALKPLPTKDIKTR